MSLKDLIADVNVNEICEHIETETLSEWVNAWQETAISALRPVRQEQVEKVWHGRWEFLGPNNLNRDCMCGTCSVCHVRSKYIVNTAICPNCGARMDKEAKHEAD